MAIAHRHRTKILRGGRFGGHVEVCALCKKKKKKTKSAVFVRCLDRVQMTK